MQKRKWENKAWYPSQIILYYCWVFFGGHLGFFPLKITLMDWKIWAPLLKWWDICTNFGVSIHHVFVENFPYYMLDKMQASYIQTSLFTPFSDHINPEPISNYMLWWFCCPPYSSSSALNLSWLAYRWSDQGLGGGRGERFSDLQVEMRQWRENNAGLPHVGMSTRERGKRPHPRAVLLRPYK